MRRRASSQCNAQPRERPTSARARLDVAEIGDCEAASLGEIQLQEQADAEAYDEQQLFDEAEDEERGVVVECHQRSSVIVVSDRRQ